MKRQLQYILLIVLLNILFSQYSFAEVPPIPPSMIQTLTEEVASLQVPDLHFNKGEARFEELSANRLREIGRALASTKFYIQLAAHADSDGDPSSNLELTEKRIDYCRSLLLQVGVTANQIVSQAFGERFSTGRSEAAKASERRVEIKILTQKSAPLTEAYLIDRFRVEGIPIEYIQAHNSPNNANARVPAEMKQKITEKSSYWSLSAGISQGIGKYSRSSGSGSLAGFWIGGSGEIGTSTRWLTRLGNRSMSLPNSLSIESTGIALAIGQTWSDSNVIKLISWVGGLASRTDVKKDQAAVESKVSYGLMGMQTIEIQHSLIPIGAVAGLEVHLSGETDWLAILLGAKRDL